MLQFFRNLFKSKLGLGLTFGFLALIALAFATADVSNSGTFGGVAGGDRVAVVGDARISTAEFSRAASQALDRARQQDPTLSMPAFIAQGGLDQVLNSMIDRTAIAEYARLHGFRAGDDLINSEIRKIGAFRGPDGNFSAEVYKNALAQQGLNDKLVREDLGKGLLAQLLLEPASVGVRYPTAAANRYALLFKERRIGSIGFLPSAAFAPSAEPDAATLDRYYRTARARFIRPERRVIRYATFGPEAVEGRIAPTPAQIAARYKQDAEKYSARETRSFTQLIVPTQQAANAIAQRVSGGSTLEAAAAGAGLKTSEIKDLAKPEVASRMSSAVADAFFAASQGALTKPARDSLGWHLARVDAVTKSSGKSLAEATPEITEVLTKSNRERALADLSADVEQQLDEGATLPDIVRTLKLTPQMTAPIIATGQGYGGGAAAPAELAPLIATAFQMEESAPQVAQLSGSDKFVVFEVTQITPSAAAPLAEIRPDVIAAWRQAEGAKIARAAADKVLATVKSGTPLGAAIAAAKPGLPAPEQIDLSREELAKRQQRVEPPLALLFSMAQGAAKRLEAPRDAGWYVVDLDRIELGKLEPGDPLALQARQELSQAFTSELTQQAVAAIRKELGVEINRAAVDSVRKQLTGVGN
jgi:peptidyl-prolyl cis-trans isomerase D